MTATTIALVAMSEAEHRALRRAVIASTVGTTIEWYDFLIYSTMTGLVFGKVFFAGSDPLIDTLKAFGVFFIGFVARPIGAAIFGHYGDRIGRKATLIVTLLMTGHRHRCGRAGPRLRHDRHLGCGHPDPVAPDPGDRRRRRVGRLGLAGDGMGAHQQEPRVHRRLAAIRRSRRAVPGEFGGADLQLDFRRPVPRTWGWRIPFLLSIVMVGVGLWIRLGILETPVFRRVLEENRVARAPTIEVFRRQPKTLP